MRRTSGYYLLIASITLLLLVLLLLLTKDRGTPSTTSWDEIPVGIEVNLRGLCVVNSEVVWISGQKGRVGRTVDGGKSWSVVTVPDAEKLDFRDIEAFSESTAYAMSAGPGEESRIYKTIDGGTTWTLQFKNSDPDGFLDAIAFWDEQNGIAFGDPVKGKFQLMVTDDGANWKPLAAKNLPDALPDEAAFAASGTCLVTHGANDVWFATGGHQAARVFHSSDRGLNWTVHKTPLISGSKSAGIFSIAFRDRDNGMIVGGYHDQPNNSGKTVAITTDGGATWTVTNQTLPYRSCVAWAKDRWVVVGTSGSNSSTDNGVTWKELDREKYNSVAFAASGDGWAVGPDGRVAKFRK